MLDLLAYPPLFAAAALLLGLLVGSFLNVVIYRLPLMMEHEWRNQCAEMRGEPVEEAPFTLARPRSRCPACGHPISALENIPVFSWLFLRGRCSACRASISWRYPLVEALTGVLTAFVAWHFGFGWQALGGFFLLWALVALTVIDFDTQFLPDSITLPLLWLGLFLNLFSVYTSLESAVIGAMAGYLILWSVYWLFKLIMKKEGMGYGDFKLLAALGAWLGWKTLPFIILCSSFVGAIVGISLIVFARHGRNVPIPFGPYLAVAGFIALIWGESLTRAYLSTF
ncbi:MAG: A24 family peptidase [Betaproteobacteria bacterium]|nr:A24 family peptidase [Betaproteobacteria bacterium]